jgi:hypothetical protein
MRKMSGFLAFMLFFSYGTSAFASSGTDVDTSSEYLNLKDFPKGEDGVIFDKLFKNIGDDVTLVEGSKLIDEFVDEEGRNNKMVIEMGAEENIVSIFVDGELEQQSVVDIDTGEITGFANYGEREFEKNISDLITVDNTLAEEDDVVSPMALNYYSRVASKKSVSSSVCVKTITAYLYEKTTITNSKRYLVNYSRGEALSAIVVTIISAFVFKSKITVKYLKEALFGVGASVVLGALKDGFKGAWQVRTHVADYYGSTGGATGPKYFTNRITNEYFTLYNDRVANSSKMLHLGEHISAYGKPKTYSLMLNHTIGNWANATRCK